MHHSTCLTESQSVFQAPSGSPGGGGFFHFSGSSMSSRTVYNEDGSTEQITVTKDHTGKETKTVVRTLRDGTVEKTVEESGSSGLEHPRSEHPMLEQRPSSDVDIPRRFDGVLNRSLFDRFFK